MDVRLFAFMARQPSARLAPRDRFCGLPKRGLAILLANAMFWQPLWAQADGIAVSGSNTTLGQAGNGVPVVNIAAPNGSGLSHNRFSDYNVGREGVILNNATNRTQATQLGGIILGNTNLQGQAAGTILNEVTGANASRLQGYTEVAGQSARVIVANPHGISCDGCGFINTPRATLTTGKPVLDNGRLAGYQVDGGAIAIEGAGLNASNIDGFELITRSAQINAKLHAKKLDIVTGRNDVDADTLKATARASDGSQAPTLAIDSSALGGMYAGTIRLVGTEQGVGVKVAGDMAASAGDLNIDANGKLTLGNASASANLNINAAQVELAGTTYAGGNASVRSAGDVQVHKSLAARDRLSVDGQQVRNTGVIEAGVEADNSRNQAGDLVLTSSGLANSGQVVASRELKATVSGTLDNTGGALKGRQLVVDADTLLNQGGQVLADQHLQAEARLIDNRNAGALSSAGSAAVTARERLQNQGGKVVGVDQLTVAGGEVNNSAKGLMASDGVVEIHVDGLDNQGGKVSASDLQVTAGTLSNQGGSLVGKTVQASAEQLHNNGGSIVATEGSATVTGRQLLDNSAGTLQAGTHLQVNGGELRNVNGAMLGASVGITGDSLDNRQNGRVVAEQGALSAITGGLLNNDGGRLQATEGAVDVGAGGLSNQAGTVVAQQQVKLDANNGSLDNRGGQVLGSAVELAGASVDNSAGGKVLAGSGGLKVSTARLLNQQGTLLAGGSSAQLLLGDGRLDNQQGSISASSVTLVAGDADNSGGAISSLAGNLQLTVQRLTNRNGLLEASQAVVLVGQSLDNSQNGRLIAHQGDAASLRLTGLLDNQGGRIASATGDFDIQAASLLNQGGSIEHAGAGKLQLTAASFTGGQGSVRGQGTGQFNLATVEGVGTWHLNGNLDISGLQSIALNAGERIASAANLSLGGGSLNNAGELLSDGTLTLSMGGALTNQGLISSLQGMHIEGASLTQAGGRIASGGPMLLQLAGALSNQGRLTSSSTLQVNAGSIVNLGTLGAQGNVTLRAASIENQDNSLTFAGGALALRSTSLLNRYADLYSKGDLSFAGLDEGRAQSLQNLSGSIESEGSIDIKTDSLENAKAVFVPGKTVAERYIRINCTDCSGDEHTGFYIVTTTYKGTVESDSPAARLLANRDLTLDTLTVDNRQSLLAANGNLSAKAVNFYNRGLTLDNQVEEVSYWLHGVSQSAYRVAEAATNSWNARNRNLPPDQQAAIPTAVTRYPVSSTNTRILPGTDTAYAGTVQAGGTVALNVSGELVNGTLDPHSNAQLTGKALDSAANGAGGVQVTLGTQAGDPGLPRDVKRIETTAADGSTQVSFVPVDFSGAPFVSIDPTALPSFHLPQGEYGLFVRSQNPTSSYLIETNPELTNLSRFMASDYLLGQLGFDADQAWRRLGDGRYETRLVADAVLAQTGQRFLADGLNSDYEQFKYLMDNAVASKDALGLSVGVGLTSQQVAALTHDIVWMEERVVDGQTVLAPVLYLAKVNARNLRGGSLIQGRDLQLVTGGDLKNVGTLRASEDLSAVAGGSLYQGGLVQANEHLALMAQDSIRNALAGEIRGNQVDLMAVKGDIVNDRTATEVAVGAGSVTRVDAGSQISARSGMTLDAGGDLTNKGSLASGGDLAAMAGGDINLQAVQDRTLTQQAIHRGLRTDETITQLGSSLRAVGDVRLLAGNDANATASTVQAGRNLSVQAGNDVKLVAAANESHMDSRSKKVTQTEDRIQQVGTTLQAGSNVTLNAGRDMAIVASKVKAEGHVDLDAAQDLLIASGKDESASYYLKKSKGSFGRSSSTQKESYHSTNVASEIEAGGDLTVNVSKGQSGGISLDGGRNVSVVGSQLGAGGDLMLGAKGDVAVVSGVEEHGEYSKKTKSGFLGMSKSGKSQLQTTATQVASELQAGNDIVVAAGSDVRLRASEASAGKDVELRAGLLDKDGDIDLLAANDTSYSYSEQYRKKTGLSASGGFVSISSAKKAGQDAQSSTSVGSLVEAQQDASLRAERDINVVGSGISAGRNVSLNAGRDVNVAAAQNTHSEGNWSSEKRTGIGVSGDDNGVSLFLGAEQLKEKDRLQQQLASASKIKAGQDLDIQAGGDINQTGSDFKAGHDINLRAGGDINLDAARELEIVERQREMERQGLGLTINHNLGNTKDAVNGAGKGENGVSQASSVLRAVDTISQFFAGPTADGKLGTSKQSTSERSVTQGNRVSTLDAGNDINLEAGNDVNIRGGQLQAGRDIAISGRDINLDVAKGSQTQENQQSQSWSGIHGGTSGGFKIGAGGSYGVADQDAVQGTSTSSELSAGRDVVLDARHDVNIVGSKVSAERDIDIAAGNDLNIRSAQNDSDSSHTRHNGGGEAGLAFGDGKVGFYASVNIGKGDLEREGQQQQQAYLYAGDQLKFSSGKDTTIAGAQLNGNEVIGRVGGDLAVASVADTGKVEGKEFDLSAIVSVGVGASASGSLGYGQTTGKTDWVQDQTRIVGHEKVDIRTENHTQIDGALIAADNGNLKLDTGTLGYSDIAGKDKEHGYYLNAGGSWSQGANGKTETSGNLSGWEYEKDREQIVRATVGAGEIIVRDDAGTGKDSAAGLNRDLDKAYEITRDHESRTDLYVSDSSVRDVLNADETLQRWRDGLLSYDETAKKNYQDASIGLNATLNRLDELTGREWSSDVTRLTSKDFANETLAQLILGGKSLSEAKAMMADKGFQENVLAELSRFWNIPPDTLAQAQQLVDQTLGKPLPPGTLELDPSTVTLTMLQDNLRSLANIKAFIDDNQDKAQAIGIVLALTQGPKGVIQAVAMSAAEQTPLGQALMERLGAMQEYVGKAIAVRMEGSDLSTADIDGKYLIGGGNLAASILGGTITSMKGGKNPVVNEKPEVRPIEVAGTGKTLRSMDELLPNGKVPTHASGDFGRWFDNLTPDELNMLWADPKIKPAIERQIRKPGGLHEWCMVCRAPTFKEWGVSMDEIQRFRTRTAELNWINPKDGVAGGHGREGSGTFHRELENLIDSSRSLKEFNEGIIKLRDRWQIDPKLLPELPRLL
ncbi:hemagglutinin repeat-containing protein [Pseudomonas fakonensis]|uniref:Hemagglutinin repeat-containing protein n=1 Tax=Pseudomonas fakonensis TaxID=2842355 RepID=A0ABX8MXT9_9PSED|nr:hemagglutinin repeat-containing protein [Pseudomonas fakonensis]QXH49115.1 hemagglutinin repeat-containing protein [Pseudomonas fakonensis]